MYPIPLDFNCKVCGKKCPVAPNSPELPVCEEHCEDHQYYYEKCMRRHVCIHCDKERPEDW